MKHVSPQLAIFIFAAAAHAQEVRLLNGIPMADQFPGGDLCVRLRAAAQYAVAHGISYVDATHFAGNQSCSVDPVRELASGIATVPITIRFGAVTIRSSVPWRVTNPGINLQGFSPQVTKLFYTGRETVPAVLTEWNPGFTKHGDPGLAGNLDGNEIHSISFASTGNATDGIYLAAWNHGALDNVWTWGVRNCGIETFFAVTDSFYRVKSSNLDAVQHGLPGPAPAHGLCLSGGDNGNGQTTDGTVVDSAAEGTSGAGWYLHSASSMTFTSGTSEGNRASTTASGAKAGGMVVDKGSYHNTFLSLDLEGDEGGEVYDDGNNNTYLQIIGSVKAGKDSEWIHLDTTTGALSAEAGARWATLNRGFGEIVNQPRDTGKDFNGAGFNWNRFGHGELDIENDVNAGGCIVSFSAHTDGKYREMGCIWGGPGIAGSRGGLQLSGGKVISTTNQLWTNGGTAPGSQSSIQIGSAANPKQGSAIQFPNPFPSAKYGVSCTGIGPSGSPGVPYVLTRNAGGVTIGFAQPAGSSWSEVDCQGFMN